MIEWYQAGSTLRDLAGLCGVDVMSLSNGLRAEGVRIRNNSTDRRRHTLNDQAFDQLTPEACYWAGFLFADGSLRGGVQTITLKLATKDRGHVEAFQQFIGSSHKIVEATGRWGATAQLAVGSSKMHRRLAELGMRGPAVHPELRESPHFWRGLWDGDGSLGLYRGRATGCVVGHQWLMTECARYLCAALAARVSARPMKSIYRVSAGGRTMVRVAELLYLPGQIALPRKAECAQRIREHYELPPV